MTLDTGHHRGRPRSLTVDAVVDAATTIVENQGSAALTIRRCAQTLGVAPNAIYTYFRSKDALLDAVADRLLSAIELPAEPTGDDALTDWLIDLGTALRIGLLAQPAATTLLSTRAQQANSSWELGERILRHMAHRGITDDDAVRALYLFIVYVVGSVMLESAEWPTSDPVPAIETRITSRRQIVDALSPEEFPITRRQGKLIANWISDEQFVWGLRRIITATIRTEH
ncbi:MAG: TetR family transcriptional regulator [Actinomycetota bacterium]|nr:MAG: TetR family transcriptional regulator [Acidimicrobiaceae bacterium]